MRATCGVMSARTPSMRPESWSTSLNVLQIEVVAGAGEQRLDVLEQRRHDQFVAVHDEQIEHRPPQALDARGLGGQDVLDVLGQEPGAHAETIVNESGDYSSVSSPPLQGRTI